MLRRWVWFLRKELAGLLPLLGCTLKTNVLNKIPTFAFFFFKMRLSLHFFHLGKTGIDGGLLHKPSSVKWTLERAYLYSETWLQLICKVWHMVESGLNIEASWDLSWWKENYFGFFVFFQENVLISQRMRNQDFVVLLIVCLVINDNLVNWLACF